MTIVGLIPARFASVRFPGKPLALLAGKPMVVHVLDAARSARRLDRVAVATDDERIADAVRGAGGEAVMTSPECASGTDRLAQAARAIPGDVYVNIQGDEPLMSSANIDRAVDALLSPPGREIASVWVPLSPGESADPNAVKVAVAGDGRALYFSRAAIPFPRGGAAAYRKHLGLYAYRADTLHEIARLPPSALERMESLEQLRWLEAGYAIWMGEADSDSIGVDTPADLARAEDWMKARQEASA
ncbi:MAG: 3-deoxy-manno-octulosonate cytidylyltransferase [Acidobacteria bacterium]|nr:3-deoxy-manno-octulosonate cytidylyltransferase [Acidobacteriota bacterium]MCA1609356.1 3-deoxy-manno-octulosonate cytidylyltransferase [Acidobacteriota bacterium]